MGILLKIIILSSLFYLNCVVVVFYKKENKELRKIIYSKDNLITSLRITIDSKNEEINKLKEGVIIYENDR